MIRALRGLPRLNANILPKSRSVTMDAKEKPIEAAIRQKLNSNLELAHLEIMNESYMHNVPKGSETHFKILVVSEKFAKVPNIQRHRMVNGILDTELKNGVHALSIVAKTPDQWDASVDKLIKSPNCEGGFGR